MNEHIFHSGMWGVAIIVIVLISWFLYRYLAPRTWRDWAGAGLVQAFVIALYAEMYGFPLTIYLLVRFFGLDRSYLNANLWSTLLGMGETGMMISMLLGYGLAIVGIGLFASGWRAVHRARKEERLITGGLYSFVRHPQYLGLFIALFGEGVVHWPTIFSVALFPVIVGTYYVLARREERAVLDQYGDEYRISTHDECRCSSLVGANGEAWWERRARRAGFAKKTREPLVLGRTGNVSAPLQRMAFSLIRLTPQLGRIALGFLRSACDTFPNRTHSAFRNAPG